MAKRLDDLFDPARLGGLWTPAPAEAVVDAAHEARTPPLVLLERRLRAAVVGRFGEARAAATSSIFEQIEEQLRALSPDDEGAPPDDKAVEAARAQLEPMLYDLEDLIDALEVAVGAAGVVRGAAATAPLGGAAPGGAAGGAGVGAGVAGAAAGAAAVGTAAAVAVSMGGGGEGGEAEPVVEGLEGVDGDVLDDDLLGEEGGELVDEGKESMKELLADADMSKFGLGGGGGEGASGAGAGEAAAVPEQGPG